MVRPPPAGLGTFLAALLALTACGDDGPGDPGSTESSSADDVPDVDVEPAEVVPESTWSNGTIEIDYADGLTAMSGAVYVKTDDGHVVRVDAASGEVTADVRVDTASNGDHYCLGIGSDGDTLWACSAGDRTTDLVRLDPESLEVLDTVEVDKVFDQLTLPVVDGAAWVLSGAGAAITRVDTTTAETTTLALDRSCYQLAVLSSTVYATCAPTDEVVAIDAGTGEVTAEAEVPGAVNVSVGAGSVWVGGSDGVVRLSPDLQPQVLYDGLRAGAEGDVVATDDDVWVRQPAGFLFRIDPATDIVTSQYVHDPPLSGGSVLGTADGLWATASDDDLVLRIDPD